MSDDKKDHSHHSTQEPTSSESQNADLQKQVDLLSKRAKESDNIMAIMTRFWTGVAFFLIAGLIVNFTCLPADMRPLMPKIPKVRLGSTCLWFDDESANLCAVWNIYTTLRSPQAPDTGGYEDACKAAGRTVKYKNLDDGPVRDLWVVTWACEK